MKLHTTEPEVKEPNRRTLSGKVVSGPTALHSLYGLALLKALQRPGTFAGIPNKVAYRANRRAHNRASGIARRITRNGGK